MERKEVAAKAQAAKLAEIIQTVAAALALAPSMDEMTMVQSPIEVFTMHR